MCQLLAEESRLVVIRFYGVYTIAAARYLTFAPLVGACFRLAGL